MEKMSLELFAKMPPGVAMLSGILPNSPEGIFMTTDGGDLRWVAVKGFANDWCIYCGWSWNTIEHVISNGDKITMRSNILHCFELDEELLKLYRY